MYMKLSLYIDVNYNNILVVQYWPNFQQQDLQA